MNPIQIVSLGSGVADNISIRAFMALKECEIIFAPSGEAIRMLERLTPYHNLMPKVVPFDIPMLKETTQAEKVYSQVTQQLIALHSEDKRISLVTIGDVGIYSSAYKIVAELNGAGIDAEIIPGLPSFVASMATVGMPLVEQGENLLILSTIYSIDDILQPLRQGSVVVVMKLSLHQEMVKELLHHYHYQFAYIEKLGDPQQFCTTNLAELSPRQCPYLSVIIIKPKVV